MASCRWAWGSRPAASTGVGRAPVSLHSGSVCKGLACAPRQKETRLLFNFRISIVSSKLMLLDSYSTVQTITLTSASTANILFLFPSHSVHNVRHEFWYTPLVWPKQQPFRQSSFSQLLGLFPAVPFKAVSWARLTFLYHLNPPFWGIAFNVRQSCWLHDFEISSMSSF